MRIFRKTLGKALADTTSALRPEALGKPEPRDLDERPDWMVEGTMEAILCSGHQNLDVVGESMYQDNLWRVIGDQAEPWQDRIRVKITALLVPEPQNPHDPNAVAVWIDGFKVGHLPKEKASLYLPGILAIQQEHGKPVALAGVIAGRGMSEDDEPGMLGVFLDHDPEDFNVSG